MKQNHEDLLYYYNRELSYLYEAGADFAKKHPAIANSLKLLPGGSGDAHVELLIQAFAFLTARLRKRMADNFPELTGTLLNILYPHYQTPIPPLSIVKFQPTADVKTINDIPYGTLLETDPSAGDHCRFQTCYNTSVLPIAVLDSEIHTDIPSAVLNKHSKNKVTCCLKLKLKCLDPDLTFAELMPQKFRFHLNGPFHQMLSIYSWLFQNTQFLGIGTGDDAAISFMPISQLQAVGFNEGEGLYPHSERSHIGYRLLAEYFTFPQKYLFFDIVIEKPEQFYVGTGNQLELLFFLDTTHKYARDVSKMGIFVPNCTPIINLFPITAEPITWSHTQSEYKIIPDSWRPKDYDIFSITKVQGILEDDKRVLFHPFFYTQQTTEEYPSGGNWLITREMNDASHRGEQYQDTYISLVNNNYEQISCPNSIIYIDTLCMNRRLPQYLFNVEYKSNLQLVTESAPLESIQVLRPPTSLHLPLATNKKNGALLAHLTLNHINFSDGEQAIETLHQTLSLYNFTHSEENAALIASLETLKSEPVIRRIGKAAFNCLCQGTRLVLTINETNLCDHNPYLFLRVLEQYFGLMCNINTFIELQVKAHNSNRVIYAGKPNAGYRAVI